LTFIASFLTTRPSIFQSDSEAGNHRNGYGSKGVLTDTGKLELSIRAIATGASTWC
jgi:hypothetical protein